MKRLYVRPDFRHRGVGRNLAVSIIKEVQNIGYKKMRLDTVPSLVEAIALYCSLDFRKIAPYYNNPLKGAIFMELDL